MRILQVRFKNLNSLVGAWEIDFAHPAFMSDAIFSITGPTGAGKTTILDAICLALYGRTPRLSKVTKGGNEIMSRQTGECYAEVTFETQAGRYRCHWSQHRARKKPDGELQIPRHEIAEADSGKILETKLLEVTKRIEATTGMDFARFTRSMLLAQGDFAAFLQAAPDERAPILEQITGTEIYSRISIYVHERRSAIRKLLETLLAESAGIQLLSEADEQQYHISLTQKIQQDVELGEQISQQQRAIVWLENIARLESELKSICEQRQAWQVRITAFAPEREKLEMATRAFELAGDYAGLVSIRREQESDRDNFKACSENLLKLEQAVRLTQATMTAAVEQLRLKQAKQQEALPLIRKVRELDIEIREKARPIKTVSSAASECEQSLATLRASQKQDNTDLDNMRKALETLLRQLDATQTDGALVEHLAGIQERSSSLKTLHAQCDAKLEAIRVADQQVAEATRSWQVQVEKLETLQRSLVHHQGEFVRKQAEYKRTLEDQSQADWRNKVSVLSEQKASVDKAVTTIQALTESRQMLAQLDQRLAGLTTEKSRLIAQLEQQETVLASLEREASLLETQRILIEKIKDYEDARQQLQDGEPCPLCGAREHPFAAGNIPVPDETASALKKLRATLKTTADDVASLKIKLAEVNKDIEQMISRQQERQREISTSEVLISQYCAALSLDAAIPDLPLRLERLQRKITEQLMTTTRILQAAEAMENEITVLRESLDKSRESAVLAEHDRLSAQHKKESAMQLLEHLKQETKALTAQQEKSLHKLQQDISVYGVEIPSLDHLDQIGIQLTTRRNLWIQRQNEKSVLEQQIDKLTTQIVYQAEQLQKYDGQLTQLRDQLHALQREHDDLSKVRRTLLGDRQPDDEEYQLAMAVESAQKHVDISRQKLDATIQEQNKLKNRMEDLVKNMAVRTDRLKMVEEAFAIRLSELGFRNEAEFESARLAENERKVLAQQAQTLADEKAGLDMREKDLTAMLEVERRKQVTDQTREALDQALTNLLANQKALQQEIGSIRQKLEDNENLKQRQQKQAQLIEAQQREYARWDLLHELIGSADGKKYRNFAQGLTFEMMIGHANRQLQKMSDRYLLIRDEIQPLELNVIDSYQAGEIRSTKNLSGGESFIVSLSLALGLSHMASKNVRVDSLFLDEGFGTLDEEALDTALETLAGLQQEGKLIGIISHVPALRERISTQIQVIPRTGGRSILSGPGCSKLSV